MIEYLRKKMHESILKYGLKSEEAYEASTCLDKEISKYYELHPMRYYYEESINGIKKYIKKYNKRPTKKQWNRYAKNNNYLSSESMNYIGKIKFNE